MGACASRSKVSKSEGTDAPAPPPEPELTPAPAPAPNQAPAPAPEPPKEEAPALAESKEVVVGVDKISEIVEDDKVDEQGSKRRSLSLLFKENEEGKDSTKNDTIPSEPMRQEPLETDKPTKKSETKILQPQKSEAPVVKETLGPFVDAPEKTETEKVIESHPATETEKQAKPALNTTEEKRVIEAIAPATKIEIDETSAVEKTEAANASADEENIKLKTEASKSDNRKESPCLPDSSVKVGTVDAETK